MSETGWVVIALLGFAAITFSYIAFTTWLDRKYPYIPPARRIRATPPPMWTSSTTTWTKESPPEKPEPKEEL